MAKPTNIGPATRQELSTGPRDMANDGGKKPNVQTTSTMVPMSRDAHPVANIENRAGMGKIQSTSTQCSLSRKESDPYDQFNKIDPGRYSPIQGAGGGRGRKK